MSRQLALDRDGWEDYTYWQRQDRKTLKRVNALIQEVMRDPFKGTKMLIGEPVTVATDDGDGRRAPGPDGRRSHGEG